jgi:hypothetical protein
MKKSFSFHMICAAIMVPLVMYGGILASTLDNLNLLGFQDVAAATFPFIIGALARAFIDATAVRFELADKVTSWRSYQYAVRLYTKSLAWVNKMAKQLTFASQPLKIAFTAWFAVWKVGWLVQPNKYNLLHSQFGFGVSAGA